MQNGRHTGERQGANKHGRVETGIAFVALDSGLTLDVFSVERGFDCWSATFASVGEGEYGSSLENW